MAGVRPREQLRGEPDEPHGSLGGEGPITPRQVFSEMAKGEIEDRPLSWGRRRRLIRYGTSLGMDAFEARLLIRAIEYASGHVMPAAMADIETPVERAYLAESRGTGVSPGVVAILLCGVFAAILGLLFH